MELTKFCISTSSFKLTIQKIFFGLFLVCSFSFSNIVHADNWTEKAPLVHPAGIFRGAMAVDEGRGVTVLFGGLYAGIGQTDKTWEWDGTNWALISTPQSPPPMSEIGMTYNPTSGKILMVGSVYVGANPIHVFQTWEYDGVTWTQLITPTTPPARIAASLVFDSARNVAVLYGGKSWVPYSVNPDGYIYFNDTWEFNGSDWTEISTANSPRSQAGAMVYDSKRELTYLFGGAYKINGIPKIVDETWQYDGTDWTKLTPQHAPSPRSETTMYYDKISEVTVLFSGAQPEGGYHYLNDTWIWNGTDWREIFVGSPPPYRKAAMTAYDPSRNRGVLFGGFTGGSSLSDTWEFALTSAIPTPIPTNTLVPPTLTPTNTPVPPTLTPTNTTVPPTPTNTATVQPMASPFPIATSTPSLDFADCTMKDYTAAIDTLGKQLQLLHSLGIEVSKKIKDQRNTDYSISLKNNLDRLRNLAQREILVFPRSALTCPANFSCTTNSHQANIQRADSYIRKISDIIIFAIRHYKIMPKASTKVLRNMKSRRVRIVQNFSQNMHDLPASTSSCSP